MHSIRVLSFIAVGLVLLAGFPPASAYAEEATHPDNPINPATGEQYPDRMMEVFDRLRELFPENVTIPKRLSQAERAREGQRATRLEKIGERIENKDGKLTRAEVEEFYDWEIRQITDRIQLIEHVLDEKSEILSDEAREAYRKVLRSSRERARQLRKAKAAALEQLAG